ncbi:carbohydrate kinase family protein [Thalassoroseus pseudoceratinae]|uniref:carbohydrate kinase family protein n=1 Tax=Thalassoroseus pseudoceratinae TaxID=2713176 RepID=UPI001420DFAD|nr:carbohydrate kinase family protein [Thalassoroseus pseudoceratinae]
MSEPSWDCLCAGIVVADHVCAPIARMPHSGELVLTKRMELTVGGCAANVSVDLAKLGRRVAMSGFVGEDAFGSFVRQTMQSAGVNCDQLLTSTTRETSGTLVVNCEGEDRRFIHSIGSNAEFTGRDLTPERIASARVLYLGGYLLCEELAADHVAAAFRTARELGVTTILDVVVPAAGDYWSRVAAVLPFTDVFLPNTDEAKLITGLTDPTEQAQKFRDAGAKTVAITCGDTGAVLQSAAGNWRSGRFDVAVVDGTGSGDAFAAGFIHGLLADADPETCLQWGSALGASCVQAVGATTGVFSDGELRQFCAANQLAIEPV